MKDILWADYGGAVATAALVQVTKSGKVLGNVSDLDLWVEGAVVAADLFASEHMGAVGAGLLNGAGIAAATLFTQTMLDRYVIPSASSVSTSTSSTSNNASQSNVVSTYYQPVASTPTATTSTNTSTTASANTGSSDIASSVS